MSDHVDLLIAASRDDELSVAEQGRLDTHLVACARCAALARSIERNDSLLAQREPSIAARSFEAQTRGARRGSVGFAFAAAAAVVLAIVFGAGLLAGVPRREVAEPPTAARPVGRCADGRPAVEIAAAGTLPREISSPEIVCIMHAVRSGPGHDRTYRLKDGRHLHVYLYEGQLPIKPTAPTRDAGALDLGGSTLAWAILDSPRPLLVVSTQLPALYVSLDVPLQEQARDLELLRDLARPLVVAASGAPSSAPPPLGATELGATMSARGLGELRGDWAFVLRRWIETATSGQQCCVPTGRASDTLTLIRLADGHAVDLVTFRSQLDSSGTAPSNMLAAQLSPDGRLAVLAAGVKRAGAVGEERLGLVVIDLATGALRQLTTDPTFHDDMPAWSPDGSRIAFARYRFGAAPADADGGLWIVNADGTGLRRLLPALPPGGPKTFVFTWTPDSRWIGFSQGSGQYELLELETSQRAKFARSPSGGRDAADWRRGTPGFVGAFSEGPRGGTFSIEVADAPSAGQRAIVSTRPPIGSAAMGGPRWRPGTEEVLYLHLIADGPTQLRYLSTRGGEDRVVTSVSREARAEWTPDGGEIAIVEGQGVAAGLTLVAPNGSSRRTIWSTGGAPETSASTVDFGTLRF